jgi:L-rhamnose mutarotase
MNRKTFIIQARPGKLEEYIHRHNPIWPELEALMKSHGIHQYSIHLHEPTQQLFGYFEYESMELLEKLAQYPIQTAWWKDMTQLLVCNQEGDDKAREESLREVFYMP